MFKRLTLGLLLLASVALISACSPAERAYFKAQCGEGNKTPDSSCNPDTWWNQSSNSATPSLQSLRASAEYQKTIDNYERSIFKAGGDICYRNDDGWHPSQGSVASAQSLWNELANAGLPDSAPSGIPVPRCTEAARADYIDAPEVDLSGSPERNDQGWAQGRSGQFSWSRSPDVRW